MDNKYDFKDLTICIPIRIDSVQRMRNISSVIRFFASNADVCFYILEADKGKNISGLDDIPNLRYEFVKDDKEIFHRTKYINLMLSKVTTRFAGVWDSDAVAPLDQVEEALGVLRRDNSQVMAYPFDGKFWNITDCFADMFHRTLDIGLLATYPQTRVLLYGYNSVGGAFLVNVELYRKYGWENEYFAGWGPEDAERFRRLEILGNTPVRIYGDLYHLNHPRGVNSGNTDTQLSMSTRKEYAKVCSMEHEELLDYVKSWPWIND